MLAACDTWSHRSVRPTGFIYHNACRYRLVFHLPSLISTYHTMSSEDVLPTYDEAMKMYQTPWHIIEDEAMNLTFRQPSSASSRIKSFISRSESASQHGVYTGPKRKSKIVVFVEHMLTGRHRARDMSQSEQYTDPSLQLELRRSSTWRSFEKHKKS